MQIVMHIVAPILYMHMDPSMTAMAYRSQMHKDATTYVRLNAYTSMHTRFRADLCGMLDRVSYGSIHNGPI
jgi:hypothetical protein